MAELVDMSPESFTLEEKRKILDDMIASSSAIENRMREDFAKLDEVTQTRLLDSLGASGCRGPGLVVPDAHGRTGAQGVPDHLTQGKEPRDQ